MKYKSELIKDIVDTRGHEKSSLHYESECVGTWIEETKGAYPKLCDYESEWLNYINENPLGKFPYETVTANPTATINNVVPYAYKSAILKGNTLINLINYKEFFDGREINSDNNFKKDYTKPFQELIIGKEYTFIVYVSQTAVGNISIVAIEFNEKDTGTKRSLCTINNPINGVNKVKFTVPSNYGSYLHSYIKTTSVGGSVTIKGMVIEGNHTQEDIPYFEGIQSVKMPVFKATGKNLFYSTFNYGYIGANGIISTNAKDWLSSDYIKLNKGTYTMSSSEPFNGAKKIAIYDDNKTFINTTTTTFTLEGDVYIRVGIKLTSSGNILENQIPLAKVQIEKGTTATSYEPFKSNILTVNEDVTLRSNGDICDELNLLTGQLTQRIGEDGVVLSQEVIKTVDLTVVNQDNETLHKIKPHEGTMNINLTGNPINPIGVFEIPVEAITQNLSSFIGEE